MSNTVGSLGAERTELVRGRNWVIAVTRALSATIVAVATMTVFGDAARAEKISNPIAEFTVLDKITGQIRTFDVLIAETVHFGALLLTPRVCYSRPLSEAPRSTTFRDVYHLPLHLTILLILSLLFL